MDVEVRGETAGSRARLDTWLCEGAYGHDSGGARAPLGDSLPERRKIDGARPHRLFSDKDHRACAGASFVNVRDPRIVFEPVHRSALPRARGESRGTRNYRQIRTAQGIHL